MGVKIQLYGFYWHGLYIRLLIDEFVYTTDWVTRLGPVRNNQYQYSIVTDGENANALYVLARNVDEFYSLYFRQVSQYLTEEGFVGPLLAPTKVLHKDDCIYPSGFP